jgi:UPF0716 protein FxsA
MGCLLLLAILVGFPVAEFWVMGEVAAAIGFWDMIALLFLSGFFGAYLARHQGAVVLVRIQQCLAEGRSPTLEMTDAAMVFVGGLLFVVPGFISDILGLILVFPLTRWLLRAFFIAGFRFRTGSFQGARAPAPEDIASSRATPLHSPGIDKDKAVDAEVVE